MLLGLPYHNPHARTSIYVYMFYIHISALLLTLGELRQNRRAACSKSLKWLPTEKTELVP